MHAGDDALVGRGLGSMVDDLAKLHRQLAAAAASATANVSARQSWREMLHAHSAAGGSSPRHASEDNAAATHASLNDPDAGRVVLAHAVRHPVPAPRSHAALHRRVPSGTTIQYMTGLIASKPVQRSMVASRPTSASRSQRQQQQPSPSAGATDSRIQNPAALTTGDLLTTCTTKPGAAIAEPSSSGDAPLADRSRRPVSAGRPLRDLRAGPSRLVTAPEVDEETARRQLLDALHHATHPEDALGGGGESPHQRTSPQRGRTGAFTEGGPTIRPVFAPSHAALKKGTVEYQLEMTGVRVTAGGASAAAAAENLASAEAQKHTATTIIAAVKRAVAADKSGLPETFWADLESAGEEPATLQSYFYSGKPLAAEAAHQQQQQQQPRVTAAPPPDASEVAAPSRPRSAGGRLATGSASRWVQSRRTMPVQYQHPTPGDSLTRRRADTSNPLVAALTVTRYASIPSTISLASSTAIGLHAARATTTIKRPSTAGAIRHPPSAAVPDQPTAALNTRGYSAAVRPSTAGTYRKPIVIPLRRKAHADHDDEDIEALIAGTAAGGSGVGIGGAWPRPSSPDALGAVINRSSPPTPGDT
jgi:hypothetical protein